MQYVLLVSLMFFSGLSWSASFVSDSSIPAKIKITGQETVGPFYLTSNNMIIFDLLKFNDPDGNKLYKYRKWVHEKGEKWKKVRTSELEELGMKEGMKFQVLDWVSNTNTEYTLKEFSYLTMVENEYYEDPSEFQKDYSRTFYLVLKDNVEGLKHPGAPNADEVTGIAYNGNEFKLKASSMLDGGDSYEDKYPKKVPSNVMTQFLASLPSKTIPKKMSEVTLKFDESELYLIYSQKPSTSDYDPGAKLYYKRKNELIEDTGMHINNIRYFRFSNFIEGADLTILEKSTTMHECYNLKIIKDQKIRNFSLMCDTGGC